MAGVGTATLDFGAAPGSTIATVTVSGVTGLLAGSHVEAWFQGDTTSGDAQQALAVMGTRARNEDGTVWCQAVAQLGGVGLTDVGISQSIPQDTWRSLTTAAFAIVGAVETACRTDPSLGIAGTPFIVCEIGTVQAPHRYFTELGAVCSVVFGVDYRARI